MEDLKKHLKTYSLRKKISIQDLSEEMNIYAISVFKNLKKKLLILEPKYES